MKSSKNMPKPFFKRKYFKAAKYFLAKHIKTILYKSHVYLLNYFIVKRKFSNQTSRQCKPAIQYNTACILDEFSYQCFQPELNLFKLDLNKFIDQIKTGAIDFLFVESAWRGNDGQWKIGHRKCFYKLLKLTNFCKKKSIPTVFWAKEDPIHFHNFIDVAKLFDYVFTTDQNMIAKYKKLLRHEDIYVLEFAMQPKLHNPIKIYEREKKFCFAGTYYQNKYPERKNFLDAIFSAVRSYGLVIYDRNYASGIEHLQFPAEYTQYVQGGLSYSEIQKGYKGYAAAINVNTVVDSPTMMSRRVYELIASYTPIISNYSLSIAKNFSEFVFFFDPSKDNQTFFNKFIANDHLSHRLQKGLRTVLAQHTYQHRTQQIFKHINLPYINSTQKILVISIVENLNRLKDIKKQYDLQTYNNKIFLGFSRDNAKTDDSLPIADFHEQLQRVDYDYLVYFNPDNYYGKYYVEDFCHALKYAEAEVITKARFFIAKNSSIILSGINDQFIYYEGEVPLSRSMINKKNLKSLDIEKETIKSKCFSTDIFNYVENASETPGELLRQYES